MRLEQLPVNLSLAAMIPVAMGLLWIRTRLMKGFAIALGALALLDLIANLIRLGAFFWWSPLHWASTIVLGVDEIIETHGVTVTTLGYVLDLVIWAAIITAIVSVLKRKTSQPASGANLGSRSTSSTPRQHER